jgi:hypothetical protein
MAKMKYFFAALLITVVFMACTQTAPPVTPGREDMLRKGKWKISKGTVTGKLSSGRDTSLDLVAFLIPVCHQDDYIVFDSQYNGNVFSGATRCDPGEGASIPFLWRLKNNGNNIDLYHGFNNVYSFTENLSAVYFDTTSWSPLVLDTSYTVTDPSTGTYSLVVLDSNWRDTIIAVPTTTVDIYDAAIVNFSQSAFTLKYSLLSTFPDTSNHHANAPRRIQDTLKYTVTYTNF